VPYQLPLKLTLKALRRSSTQVEAECIVVDGKGTSVRYLPLTMAPDVGVASVCAILQAHADDLARQLVRRGEAKLVEPQTEDELAASLEGLVGKTFFGSVAT